MDGSSLLVAPRRALAPFVDTLRVVSHGDSRRAWLGLPDGRVDLVVRLMPTDGDVHTIGLHTQALRKDLTGVPQTIAVRFKPGGAYPFFGVPMHALTNRIVSLKTLWGSDGARLRDALLEAPTLQARLALLEDALFERLRRDDVFEPASAHVVRRAVRRLSTATEPPRVDALARELGVSERQLRRVFDTVVGMGPKAFARIVRFQRALRAAQVETVPDWAAIATTTGYYDQAHLIAEFRAMTGVTPGAFLRARQRETPGAEQPEAWSGLAPV